MNTEEENERKERQALFRKAPLEKLANPEQLEAMLVVVTPKMWLGLLCILAVLLAIISWVFWGAVPVTVHGRGLLMHEKERLFTVNAPLRGVLEEIYVKTGQTVRKGDKLALLNDKEFEIKVDMTKATIEKLSLDLKKLTSEANVQQKQKDMLIHKLNNAKNELSLLEQRKELFVVTSLKNGKILELLAGEGQLLNSGEAIIWLEDTDGGEGILHLYAYFPVEQAKRLSLGAEAYIDVSSVDNQEYGYLMGNVAEIAPFPISRETIAKTLYNKELVEELTGMYGAVLEVVIELARDPNTHAYRWTTNRQPPLQISSGTVCSVQAIIQRLHPVSYLLPVESEGHE